MFGKKRRGKYLNMIFLFLIHIIHHGVWTFSKTMYFVLISKATKHTSKQWNESNTGIPVHVHFRIAKEKQN